MSHYVFTVRGLSVLMDPEDAETLQGLLDTGWRLSVRQDLRRSSSTPVLTLKGVGSIALPRAILHASERQRVIHTAGPDGLVDTLDCRKAYMVLRDAEVHRRLGWSSGINGTGKAGARSAEAG